MKRLNHQAICAMMRSACFVQVHVTTCKFKAIIALACVFQYVFIWAHFSTRARNAKLTRALNFNASIYDP